VYVVKPDRTVGVQKVKLGPTDGQRIAVLSGLQPGESVVVDGSDRLRDGAKVTVPPTDRSDAAAGRSVPPGGGQEAVAPPGEPAAQPQAPRQGEGRLRRRVTQ
jgi:multidrug efflux system membrane fusion protein